MKRQLMIAACVVLGVLALIGKLVEVSAPEKPFTREGIHVMPTRDGADATDGKFRLNLPAVPKVVRGNHNTIAVGTRGARVDVLLTIVTPERFDPDELPAVGGGFMLGLGMTNPAWTTGTLAGLSAGTASGDGTWENNKPCHLRLWIVAAPTQKRYYVLAAIGSMDVAPAELEQVATRLAFITP